MSETDLFVQLAAEQQQLRFASFSFDDALAIGLDVVETARRDKLAITVDVTVSGQQLFHAALPGTSPDNDRWVARKNRVAMYFFRSSYQVAMQLEAKGKTIEAAYGLSSLDYAAYGGAVPVTLKGGEVIGTVTVSGLPHQQDHAMVVDALRRHLQRLSV